MSRTAIFFLLLASLAIGCLTAQSPPDVDPIEPPRRYAVTLGDRTVTLSEGETLQLAGTFANPQLSLVPLPTRIFRHRNLSFEFPRDLIFLADVDDPETRNWAVAGDDFKLTYYVIPGETTPLDFAKSMVAEVDHVHLTDESKRIVLGKERLVGAAVEYLVAGQRLTQDIYRIPGRAGESRFLIFQDCLNDEGEHSREWRESLKVIRSSFRLQR